MSNEDKSRAAGQAAGYCWAPYKGGKARCTRSPHEYKRHVDHYTGRQGVTDMKGIEWTG
ncbi:hypothetical protein [Streptomyces collinus]